MPAFSGLVKKISTYTKITTSGSDAQQWKTVTNFRSASVKNRPWDRVETSPRLLSKGRHDATGGSLNFSIFLSSIKPAVKKCREKVVFSCIGYCLFGLSYWLRAFVSIV